MEFFDLSLSALAGRFTLGLLIGFFIGMTGVGGVTVIIERE